MMTLTLVVVAGMLTANEGVVLVGFCTVGALNSSLVGSLLVSVTVTGLCEACGSDTVIVVCRFWPTEALVTPRSPSVGVPFVSEKLAVAASPDTAAVTV